MEKIFNRSYSTVFDKCVEALEELDMDVDSENKTKGVIRASTGSSILSWGEDIEVRVKKVDTRKTKVLIGSEASAQLFSWGKNDKNESLIINKLSKKLSK